MANSYTQALTQILTLIRTTWNCQVLRYEQAARINWRDRIETGELSLPFAILHIATMRRTGEGAADGNVFRLPIKVVLVTPLKGGADQTPDNLSELIDLWSALYVLPGATFVLEEEGTSFDVSGDSELMTAILDGSAPLSGGIFAFSILIDLTP